MKFTIPSKFQVGGQEMSVQLVDKIENTSNLGQCTLARGEIIIANTWDGMQQSESSKLNTFFHELLHSILDTMAENELSRNEKFVSTFSGFLTEAIKSME